MAKFMVVVNAKYMVLVEANSACGAEHVILDDVRYGMETALAFGMKEINTDCFKGFMNSCETISLRELEDKATKFKAYQDQKEAEEARAKQIEKQLKELEERMNELKARKKELAEAWDLAKTNEHYYYMQMGLLK